MQLCAQEPAAVCAADKGLKISAAECADQLWFGGKRNKTQFVDVAPTLGVNHVIFGVVVLLC